MLSKDNKDLIQLQQGNLEISGFPETKEDEFHQQGQIQTGKNGGAKPESTPPMGSGFQHGIFEKD